MMAGSALLSLLILAGGRTMTGVLVMTARELLARTAELAQTPKSEQAPCIPIIKGLLALPAKLAIILFCAVVYNVVGFTPAGTCVMILY